tara:strand:- start:1484 stop:1765 length:282 start_codon:yes stop_codon:yes gene_type:complete
MDKKTRWWRWHKKNPHVYDLFESFTKTAIDAGLPHSSAWLIVNRIRWETAIKTRGDSFKISNDYIAFYARLFMKWNPEHDGFFRTKKLKDEIV